jgi:pyruvate dehydrogenase E1 component beta subunit
MKYVEAIRSAIFDSMKADPEMHILGQGVWSPFYVGSSMDGIESTFGRNRVIDTPVSENAVTGLALGAAISGQSTLVIHPRIDFMILAMDPLVNAAAKWRYSLDFQTRIPLTVRAIINRGGEQGAQHSQALHSWFAHIPGLRVVMPSSAKDAYFLLRQSIECPDPVIFIEDRWSYEYEETFEIPDELPELSNEGPEVVQPGERLTLVGIGHSTNICREALKISPYSKQVELIDVRVLQPFNSQLISKSAEKTGRLIVVDGGWRNSGFAAEVIASVVESPNIKLVKPPVRMTLPEAPAPTSPELEKNYYLQPKQVVDAIERILDA